MAATEPKTETTNVPPANAPNSTVNASEVPVSGTEPKTETDVPSTDVPKSNNNVPEVPVSATEPKTETDAPPTITPKSPVNDSEVPVSATEPKTETDVSPTSTLKSTVNVSEIKTVEVSNLSIDVKEKDIWEFFSFSGHIQYIEMKSEDDSKKYAFVTFKDSQGAETAALLTGATVGGLQVSVSPVENYKLPPEAPPLKMEPESPTSTDRKREVAQKAEEVVSTMLAKGFVLGKDALNRAKSFDKRHQLSTNASATVASIDRKMGLTQKLSTGTAVVNEKMKVVNERYQVTEKSKSAIAVAEQKANTAGSAIMSNSYVSRGAVWLSGAFAAVTKAAKGVGSKTKEKVEKAEEGQEKVEKAEEGKEGSQTKENAEKAEEEKEVSKTKENAEKAEEDKEGSKTKENVKKAKEENEGSKTVEKVHEAEEEKEGSKTNDKVHETEENETLNKVNDHAQVQVDEPMKKDSPATPVKQSDDHKNLPSQ